MSVDIDANEQEAKRKVQRATYEIVIRLTPREVESVKTQLNALPDMLKPSGIQLDYYHSQGVGENNLKLEGGTLKIYF